MTEILKLIENRQSVRGPYDPERPIRRPDLMQILEAARWAPTAHNMQNFEVVVVDDPKVLASLGAIRGGVSETFIRENYEQLSFSEDELRHRKVGILGTMFPASWRTPGMKPDPREAAAPSILGATIQASPTVLVVTFDPRRRAPASEGDFLGIISLGCVLENMWLTARELGIGLQVMSVFNTDGVEKQVKETLNIPEPLRIAFAVRLGYPVHSAEYLRVRRDVADFSYGNRYGHKG